MLEYFAGRTLRDEERGDGASARSKYQATVKPSLKSLQGVCTEHSRQQRARVSDMCLKGKVLIERR